MSQPIDPKTCSKVAGNRPIGVDCIKDQSYWWCSCGRSADQPFCDGSHKGTAFVPQSFQETADGKVWLCTCKQTQKPPYCDGSHKHFTVGDMIAPKT